MAYDRIQIALEHHQAGRLQRAEAGYRTVLDDDPGNPEAMHWMGVLAYQVGRPVDAIFWLEQAAAIRGEIGGYQFNLAHAYLLADQPDAAIKAFEKAIALEPNRPEFWLGLGIAYLMRPGATDAKAAAAAFLQASSLGTDTAEIQAYLGVAPLRSGQEAAAIPALRAAIEKDPSLLPPYHHLALAFRTLGQTDDARKALNDAIKRDSSFAPAWNGLGVLEGEAGHLDQAVTFFQRALAIRPDYAAASHGLGHVLRQAGKAKEALGAFKTALLASRQARRQSQVTAESPARQNRSLSSSLAELERKINPDASEVGLHYTLATVTGIFSPGQVPAWAVAGLFDNYADRFDSHLHGSLKYRVPEMIAEVVAESVDPDHLPDALDIGCGTGMCGALLRPFAKTLSGADLSPNMIEKSRARNVYDHLEVTDLVTAMNQRVNELDLITAGDVFVYVGDLSPAFEAAAAALRPGGRFIFSVESQPEGRFRLHRNTRRYTHAKEYLVHLADICGMGVETFENITVRLEFDQPVAGYLVGLKKP